MAWDDDVLEGDNVVVVEFADAEKAREALSVLEERHEEFRVEVRAAAVVSRREDGGLDVLEEHDHRALAGASAGSVIGTLVGALAGPFGMLLGWGSGTLVGSVGDVRRAHETDDTLAALGNAIPTGSTAVVAVIGEPEPGLVDREMVQLGGAVTRRPAAEVLSDLEAAEDNHRVS